MRARKWNSLCQWILQGTWRSGSGTWKNPWRQHWETTSTAHSEFTPRSNTFFFLCFPNQKNRCCCNISLFVDPPATSYRVGVVLARAGCHCWLSGLLDHRGVWGFGAGRLVQQPLPTATDAGQHLLGIWCQCLLFKLLLSSWVFVFWKYQACYSAFMSSGDKSEKIFEYCYFVFIFIIWMYNW